MCTAVSALVCALVDFFQRGCTRHVDHFFRDKIKKWLLRQKYSIYRDFCLKLFANLRGGQKRALEPFDRPLSGIRKYFYAKIRLGRAYANVRTRRRAYPGTAVM